MFTEQLNHAIDRAAGEKRKSEPAVQSCLSRGECPREIFVHGHVVNPSRFIRLPNPARQPFAHSELNCLGELSELLELRRARVPESAAAQPPNRFIINPERAQDPVPNGS